MIRSMTGYGSGELERNGQRLTAEIRSVNHRYCEVSIRVPRVASIFEDKIRQVVQNRFSRGKITMSISWAGAGEGGEVLKLNELAADRYMALLDQLRRRYDLKSEVDVKTLAALPDIFTWEHSDLSDEETWALVNQVVEAACDSMEAMKLREGKALEDDLLLRIGLLAKELALVAERAPDRPKEGKEKLDARLQALLGDVELDPVRLAQEVALMADRLDCTEEVVRLRAHLDQFRQLATGPELAGRKLNFLLQELNREANTIGSKSNDVEITRAVIVMKEEIERLREQVQNVE
jgi:uncharacterized protein (TIGR00255 family)